MTASYCVKQNKACVGWVLKYFKDCLCNVTDEISFAFGICSLVCWGVAEIPQIITNFQTKSSHGVSLLFLLTWIAGDIFNLVGCLLEAATLPTQFYTALLYTITTIVLVLQSVYYDHIYRWWKRGHKSIEKEGEDEKKALRPKPSHESGIVIPKGTVKETARREFYYTSARSLAGSGTPLFRSYLRTAKSGPSAMQLTTDSSDEEDSPPLSPTLPRPIPRSTALPGSYGTFLAASLNLPLKGNALRQGFAGRKLLQEHETHSAFGQWLGWLMAGIYMGGRIPQILLNIKRGSVEGLNPLMFVFALIANLTYVGSIVVRTTEWEKIKANLPWLLDAVVCVALDLFIISQYIYYRYFRKRAACDGNYGFYQEASKEAAAS